MNLPDVDMIKRLSGTSLSDEQIQQWVTDLIPVFLDKVKSECLTSEEPDIQIQVKLALAYITAAEIISFKASNSEGKSIGIGPIKLSKDASASNYLKISEGLANKGLSVLGRCKKGSGCLFLFAAQEYGG